MSKSNAGKKWSRLTWSSVVLCILTLLGLYLRVRHLGALGFWGDEDLTSLAVKAILEHGYPLLPSGMIYPRSVVLHYETFEKCSILVKVKKGDNFNHRNILNISRIEI